MEHCMYPTMGGLSVAKAIISCGEHALILIFLFFIYTLSPAIHRVLYMNTYITRKYNTKKVI